MTYRELALLIHILGLVREGNKVSISFDQKIEVDYLYNFFDNLITDIEKEKAKNPKIEYQSYRLWLDIREARGFEYVEERVNAKEKDPEKSEEDQRE